MTTVSSLGSPIRWAGSKRKLVPYLKTFLDSTSCRLIEPFCGSASLFFSVRPTEAVLNDVNVDLINALRVLRERPILLSSTLNELPIDEKTYYAMRQLELPPGFDAAIRFFYLNRFCFNGIYRTNKMGRFNVPYARSGTGGFPSLDRWKYYSSALQRADLVSMDFEDTCDSYVRKGDFVFIDPPYFIRERRGFSEYTNSAFDEASQLRLIALMQRIHEKGARFALTYERGDEADYLSKGWAATSKTVSRTVAGKSEKRVSVEEIFVSNDRNAVRRISRMD